MTSAEGFDSIILRSPDSDTEAKFVPAANMVCCSLRHNGVEFLHTGGGVAAYAREGKTMGIPLLHPWANRLASFQYSVAGAEVTLPQGSASIPVDPAGLPIHGVLPGLMRWDARQSQPGSLSATLRWESQELLELFPFPHELRLDAGVEPGSLELATSLRPTGDHGVPMSFGYHPYLRLPDAPRDAWEITLGASRRLVLDERMIPTGDRALVEDRSVHLDDLSFDDAFDGLDEPAEFSAAAAGHALRVELVEGFPYAQVYGPPGKDFVCFEPMTAPTDALNSGDGLRVVAPSDVHRTVFRISVSL